MQRTTKTHHSPIRPHQPRLLIKRVIQDWDERAPDQKHNAQVIQFVAPDRNFMAVILDCVVRAAHTQTRHCSREEAAKHVHVFFGSGLVARLQLVIQEVRCEEEDCRADQMCVDVDSLVVDVEQRLP